MKTVWNWVVPDDSPQERADKILLTALKERRGSIASEDPSEDDEKTDEDASSPELQGDPWGLSRNRLHALMEAGCVTSGKRAISPNDRLKAKQEICIVIPAPVGIEAAPEDLPLDILYEDEHLLVVNKPPKMSVHPAPGHVRGTLVNALLFHVKDLSGIGGKLRPGIVHRIDKDTSGALVVTKTDACHQKLAEIFSEHRIERRYWALCYGTFASTEEKKIESKIGRNPADRKKMAMNVEGGRKAVTHVRMLEEYGETSKNPFACWVEARLETGRTHQVRIHLTGIGHSLLGDPAYGEPSSMQPKWRALPKDIQEAVARLPGQALHARVLGFKHPITGKDLRFEAAPPPEFQTLMDLLKNRYRGTDLPRRQ